MINKSEKIKIKTLIVTTSLGILVSAYAIAGDTFNNDTLRQDTQKTLPLSFTTYTIVDTGQNTCYNNERPITCPQTGESFYGQDAQYVGVQPFYKDNGDGTVTDLNTGLMWQQDPGEKILYDQAVSGANSCTLAGYTDWRLPTIKELY